MGKKWITFIYAVNLPSYILNNSIIITETMCFNVSIRLVFLFPWWTKPWNTIMVMMVIPIQHHCSKVFIFYLASKVISHNVSNTFTLQVAFSFVPSQCVVWNLNIWNTQTKNSTEILHIPFISWALNSRIILCVV